MIHEKILLNQEGTAFVEVYALDPEISYGIKKKWPAVIICPGGGYMISATKEGEGVAVQYLAQGYSCFVLRYSTFLNNRDCLLKGLIDVNEDARYPKQVIQLMNVMHYIRENSERWSIDTANIFTIGFSAGGHITGTLAVRWNNNKLLQQLEFTPYQNELRPKGCILCYPMLSAASLEDKKHSESVMSKLQHDAMEECLYGHLHPSKDEIQQLELKNFITRDTPPIFIWHSSDDGVTDANCTTEFVKELQNKQVPCEYHLFTNGEHGLACANEQYAKSKKEIDTTIAMWLPLTFQWLEKIKKVEVKEWM